MPESFEEACFQISPEVANLVIAKQHDYGHGNILKFMEQGVLVRLSDKLERLINLYQNNSSPSNESIEDSWKDIMGYGMIGLMLTRNWFTLELKGDR